ncbi:hypothetical protein D3C78_1507700 [compost metagenome]
MLVDDRREVGRHPGRERVAYLVGVEPSSEVFSQPGVQPVAATIPHVTGHSLYQGAGRIQLDQVVHALARVPVTDEEAGREVHLQIGSQLFQRLSAATNQVLGNVPAAHRPRSLGGVEPVNAIYGNGNGALVVDLGLHAATPRLASLSAR